MSKDKYKDTIIDTLTDVLHSLDIIMSGLNDSEEDTQMTIGYKMALEDVRQIIVDQLHDITG